MQIQVTLLPIQLPATLSGKAEEDVQFLKPLQPRWETWMNLDEAPTYQTSPDHCMHSGNESVRGRSLFLYPSLLLWNFAIQKYLFLVSLIFFFN